MVRIFFEKYGSDANSETRNKEILLQIDLNTSFKEVISEGLLLMAHHNGDYHTGGFGFSAQSIESWPSTTGWRTIMKDDTPASFGCTDTYHTMVIKVWRYTNPYEEHDRGLRTEYSAINQSTEKLEIQFRLHEPTQEREIGDPQGFAGVTRAFSEETEQAFP
jgi:hypothetical protein